MIQEIKYSGFTAVPSDYECPDGELAAALNLIPEDGALHPVAPPLQLATLPQEVSIGHIHKNVGLSNYIFKADFTQEASHAKRGLYWLATSDIEDWPQEHGGNIPSANNVATMIFAQSAGSYVQRIVSDVEIPLNTINKIDSIGNTLVLLTSNGTFFFLWKNGAYVNLGEKPAPISVWYNVIDYTTTTSNPAYNHLWATYRSDKISGIEEEVITDPAGTIAQRDEVREYADYIFAAINNARQYARKANLFVSPFFIRLAYRTISGTHIMHTAPFLVVPNTNGKPFVFLGIYDGKKRAYVDFNGVSVVLRVNAIPENWKDIIEGIDIFITPEIQAYTEDPVGIDAPVKMTREDGSIWIGENENKKEYEIYDYVGTTNEIDGSDIKAGGKNDLNKALCSVANTQINVNANTAYIPLMRADGKSINDLIRDEHRYYLYKTLTHEFFGSDTYKEVQIALNEQEYASLSTREQLDDDYLSRDGIIASNSYVYNNRLNLVVDKRRLAIPDYVEHFTPKYNRDRSKHVVTEILACIDDGTGEYYTRVAERSDATRYPLWFEDLYYMFYPNRNAKALYFYVQKILDGQLQTQWNIVPLHPHPTLNGAYAFNNFKVLDSLDGDYTTTSVAPTINDFLPISSLLYTSEVNMPFIFPARNITQVGTGKILALSSATKALSQGQFGQFPLYAFTTEGVWALSVGSDGAFAAKHPVTRDVIRSAESLVQTDDSVIFAAQRGIMLLQGSSAACISEVLDSVEPFSISSLLTTAQATSLLGDNLSKLGYTPFRDFLAGSEYLYDYTHQRVVVYNDAHRYAYVFSMRSKEWGIIESDIIRTFSSYPYALAETSGGLLLDYAREQSGGTISTCLVTRPLKLGGADMLKTIDAVMQRGYIERGDVKSILFGSRDLVHWVPVWSSVDYELRGFRGTPYKYFRVMLIGDLPEDRSLYGMSVSLDMRQANKLR